MNSRSQTLDHLMWTEKKGNMGASYLKQKAFFSLTTCATAVETTAAACRSNAARPYRADQDSGQRGATTDDGEKDQVYLPQCHSRSKEVDRKSNNFFGGSVQYSRQPIKPLLTCAHKSTQPPPASMKNEGRRAN